MARVAALRCLRCDARYPADRYAEDCPACRPVAPSNLTVVYDDDLRARRAKPDAGCGRGLWRYGDLLPVTERQAVSLGEGGSPLHHLRGAGGTLGVANLLAKDESRNPTWSFKDRLACMAVSSARMMSAEVIVSSSSGNAGAAAAAYAAKAGLPCVIFTFKGTAGPMVTQMRAYGAKVVAVESKADRWTLMEMAVRRYGWFPTSPFFGPAIGSNPYGIEGYKTLAYEIAEEMDWQVPDWCVLPVCYGDALIGLWKGFDEMMVFGWTDRMPRLVAAEVYGSLGAALAGGEDTVPDMPKTHDTIAVSIGATRGTYQALEMLRRTGGTAVTVANADMMRWQQALAASDGLYVEASSAGAVVAVEQLRRNGTIGERDTVAVLLTAGGLKDPQVTARAQPEPLAVPADLDAAVDLLRSEGLFPTSRYERLALTEEI
jgi:threonine synthase